MWQNHQRTTSRITNSNQYLALTVAAFHGVATEAVSGPSTLVCFFTALVSPLSAPELIAMRNSSEEETKRAEILTHQSR